MSKDQLQNPEAVLIKDNRIQAIGSYHYLRSIANRPQKIDLEGRILLPAFTDAHTHFVETAKHQLILNVVHQNSEQDFILCLANYRNNNPLQQWISGFGWDRATIDQRISHITIDRIFPDQPVTIVSKDLHSVLINTAAMKILGLNHKHQRGFLYEWDPKEIDKYRPPIEQDLLASLVTRLIQKCHKNGLCGVHTIEQQVDAQLLAKLSDSQNFYFTVYYYDYQAIFAKESSHFRNGGLKVFADGTLGSDSAWMFSNPKQVDNGRLKKIKRVLEFAETNNLQVAIHTIGDYSTMLIANILKEMKPKVQHRLEHLQAVRPEDLSLLKDIGIHASMQAIHIQHDASLIEKKWTIAKKYAYPLNSINKITYLALGSDSPVETLNPFAGIFYATHNCFEVLSLEDALASYTYKHHIVANQNRISGKIEKNNLANLIVINKNAFQEFNTFLDEVDITIIDGVIVHEK